MLLQAMDFACSIDGVFVFVYTYHYNFFAGFKDELEMKLNFLEIWIPLYNERRKKFFLIIRLIIREQEVWRPMRARRIPNIHSIGME